MQFYIPEIGDEILLTQDWTFDLYNEYRNTTLMTHLGDPRGSSYGWGANYTATPAIIPAGAILKVDRIYIRKGASEFSSITFIWKDKVIPAHLVPRVATEILPSGHVGRSVTYNVTMPKKAVRFWAKLEDVNKIDFEKV